MVPVTHELTDLEVERRFRGEPILEPIASHDWESRVVLNPAADIVALGDGLLKLAAQWDLDAYQRRRLVTVGAACVMLYRARGAPKPGNAAPSSLGLAVFTPALQLIKRWRQPVLEPWGHYQNLGVENPRMTRVGDHWHLYYTGYAGDPGPGKEAMRNIRICHAATSDFLHWSVDGPVGGDLRGMASKNAALLPERVGREWILLHRPIVEEDPTAIHFATSDSPAGPWTSRGVLMDAIQSPDYRKVWIGVGGPPISMGDDRFVMIYHRGHTDLLNHRQYDLAAALLDFKKDPIVRSRIEPIMVPTGKLEKVGEPEVGVDDVVYSCANYVWNHDVVFPYAGADSRIFVGSVRLDSLLGALEVLA
jgi:predicted GH43/DUF377 family glycosyl hydrolase